MPSKYAFQVLKSLEELSSMINPPMSANIRKLRGPGNYHRLRSGDFRAVIRFSDGIIRVIRVFDRKDMQKMLASIWN